MKYHNNSMKMKNILNVFTMLTLFFVLGCEKPETNNDSEEGTNSDSTSKEEIFFGLNKESIAINPDGGSVDIIVYSNHKWELKGGSDWCIPSATSGQANENGEKVSFSADLTYDSRETIFWFCCADEKITFVVTQNLKEVILPDANKTFDIPAEGGIATLNYQTNINCKVIIPEDAQEWISVTTATTRGLVDESIQLNVAENTTYSNRTAIVKVVKEDDEAIYSEYIINQKQNDGLLSDENIINISSKGGNVNLTYKTNVECKIIIPDEVKDWISTSQTTKSLNSESSSLYISENTTYENRSAVVKVVAIANENLTIEYTINQEQNDAIIADDNNVFEVPYTGGEITLDYQTNVECEITIPQNAKDWISILPATRALTSKSTILRIAENNSYSSRSAVIKITKNGDNTPVIEYTICQEQNDAVIADEKNIVISGQETSFYIKYKTNVDCEIIIPENAKEWLHTAPSTKALVQQSITLYASANNTGQERSAIIQVASIEKAEVFDEYTITQNPRYLMEYTSSNGNIVTPNKEEFGAKIISNTCDNGVGIIEFDGPPTSIGDYAFQYCSNLSSITIPNSVETINKSAFYGCSTLSSIAIPESVISIKESAFYNCKSLTEITLPSSITSLGREAFKSCSNLTSVTFLDSQTSIGSWAFSNCSKLNSITFGNNITSIDGFAFEYCSALNKITIPNSVTAIGQWAFSYCKGLTEITIGDGVKTISVNAFNGCTSLDTITMGKNVTSISTRAFYDCSNLTKVHISDLNSWCNIKYEDLSAHPLNKKAGELYLNGELVTHLVLPQGLTNINSNAFYHCNSIQSITFPTSISLIESYAFYYCSNITDIYISDLAAWCNISFTNSFSTPLHNGGNLYLNNNLVTDLVLPENITEIKAYSFYNCKSLESIQISNNVSSIGQSAFTLCTNLTSVTLPNALTTIGNGAFATCTNLTSISLPENLTSIGESAFSGTTLTSITIPKNTISLGANAFQNCTSLSDLTILDSQASIGANAFSGCSALKNATLGNAITSIGNNAFKDCKQLKSIILPNTISSVGNSTFYGCSLLESATIGTGVVTIGTDAFRNCSNLRTITIPGGITSIGDSAFLGCPSSMNDRMTINVTITDLTSFCENNKISSLYGYKHLLINNEYVTNLTIPDGITKIGDNAFYQFVNIENVTIPSGVTSIGKSAFEECTNLTSVVIPNSTTSIGERLFCNCYKLANISIPEGITTIGKSTFYKCAFESITIPSTVTSIHQHAFSSCSKLASIYCKPSTPPQGGYDMFGSNAKGRKIYVPRESLDRYKSVYFYWEDYRSSIEGYDF